MIAKAICITSLSALQGFYSLPSLIFMHSTPGRSARPPFMNTVYDGGDSNVYVHEQTMLLTKTRERPTEKRAGTKTKKKKNCFNLIYKTGYKPLL